MSLKDTCALYSVDLYQYESHLLYILFRKEVTRRGQRMIILLPLLLTFSCAWCFEHCDIKHTIHLNVYTNDHWHQNRPALHDSIYTMYTYVYNKNNKKIQNIKMKFITLLMLVYVFIWFIKTILSYHKGLINYTN